MTTSAYPGVCTNFSGTGTTYSADFTISGNTLTSLDCGGMAVVRVNVSNVNYTFIVPQDSDFDGMPDIWEAKFGPASGAGSLVANADDDNDGFSNFDEYRGVMLSSSPPSQVRMHPKERDLLVTLINPGCGGATSFFGGGSIVYVPDPNDARSLLNPNLNNALPATATDPPGPRLHFVNLFGPPAAHATAVQTGEWVDSYSSCLYKAATDDLDLQFLAPPGGALTAAVAPADLDRVVTLNAVYDVSESPDTSLTASAPPPASATGPGTVTLTAGLKVFDQLHAVPAGNGAVITLTGGLAGRAIITGFLDQTRVTANITARFSSSSIAAGKWRISTNDQRGIRCVESDNTASTSTYALATWTTTNATTCTIYSKRIEFRMKNADTTLGPLGLIPKGGSRFLRIQTTLDGGKSWTTTFDEKTSCGGQCARGEAERRVIAEVMRFYVTMESLHGVKQKSVLGICTNHDCAGTGYLVDKDFTQIIDNKSSGYNTFRLPTQANSSIISGVTIRQP